ncbi:MULTISPECIES: Ig-like domain-containing protein [unclassified Nocardioides]|uniref:Ig-like domain-containing protein n=1 Tax=unclassified Nocardioides TaxID=2615069 RepID=UPI000A62BAED|nr:MULTISPECIES: Ig-like domain-containing protein [unclassified Nocardioides]
MSRDPRGAATRGGLARLGAVLVALVGLAVGPAAGPAAGAAPDPGAGDLFLATDTAGDPATAVDDGGFWGHEGPAREGATVLSADLTDGGAGFLGQFGSGASMADFALVFTPTSTDGSAEAPEVTAGQTVAEAYPYFTRAGLQTPLQGDPAHPADDQVLLVSTQAEWDDWVADGRPAQAASSDDLVVRDTDLPGAPEAAHPRGRSILDRWAAGQRMSAVAVRTTGELVDGVPVVDASQGRAQAAWVSFTTAVDPAVGDADHPGVATSGAYQLGSGTTPAGSGAATMTVLSVPSGPLTAGVPVPLTAAVVPAADGTVEVRDGTDVLAVVALDADGVAAWSWTPSPGHHTLTAVFRPRDGAAWAGSSSPPTPVEVVDAAPRPSGGRAGDGVPEGMLVVSTPYTPDHPLDLGRLTMAPDAATYTSSVPFDGVLVSDTRAGGLPWELAALATNLTGANGAVINAQNLGLVHLVADIRTGSGTAAPVDRPGAFPPVEAAAAGALGLGLDPKPVMNLTAGPGTVELSGVLMLRAPVSTPPGHYTGMVTFTID